MKRLYVRDQDRSDHVGKKLRIIRGTDEFAGTLKGQDEKPSPVFAPVCNSNYGLIESRCRLVKRICHKPRLTLLTLGNRRLRELAVPIVAVCLAVRCT